MSDVLIVSGAGEYADPWHPFAETSAALAEVAIEAGHAVRVSVEVEAELAALAQGSTPDVLVLNVGNPGPDRDPAAVRAAESGLLAHLGARRGLLGVHSCATSFVTMARWPELLGGRWARGTTWHPPLGPARVVLDPVAHPVTAAMNDFELIDERYSYLELGDDAIVLAHHDFEGRQHPLLWAHDRFGGRVLYDALGHDARSYASPEHRRLLADALAWLAG